jgi:trehalose-phosphatase
MAPVLVALDFDGTLAPITPHPEDARPVAGVHQVLRDVQATGATLAVVTGRSVSSLLRVSGFGAIPGIVIYGTHGAERWQEGSLRAAAARPGSRSCGRGCRGWWPGWPGIGMYGSRTRACRWSSTPG